MAETRGWRPACCKWHRAESSASERKQKCSDLLIVARCDNLDQNIQFNTHTLRLTHQMPCQVNLLILYCIIMHLQIY